jgi:chemosensory pili system protein ChpA (sensor histidine kinase/response regulator)
VVTHIKESLKIVEQALDAFFRNPADKAPLSMTPQPIRQVSAVFEMLGIATPTSIANASNSFIQYFQQDSYVVNQAHFELVAESLSMVGLYADEMPKTRLESEQALENALQRLNAALEAAGIAPATSDKKEHEVAAAASESTTSVPESVVTADSQPIPEQVQVAVTMPTPAPVLAAGPAVLDKAYDDELLDIYLTEAEEVLAHIAQNCQALRVNITDNEALVEVRRSFHTLKGSGRTVGLSALGEVAGKVETFFNGILDKKSILKPYQIAEVEQVAAAFAGWAAELRANNQVEVNKDAWIARIEVFPNEEQLPETVLASSKTPAKKPDEQVLIGGTRKMSRAFYDIFITESGQTSQF